MCLNLDIFGDLNAIIDSLFESDGNYRETVDAIMTGRLSAIARNDSQVKTEQELEAAMKCLSELAEIGQDSDSGENI